MVHNISEYKILIDISQNKIIAFPGRVTNRNII